MLRRQLADITKILSRMSALMSRSLHNIREDFESKGIGVSQYLFSYRNYGKKRQSVRNLIFSIPNTLPFFAKENVVSFGKKKVLANANTLRLVVFADIMKQTGHERTHSR